jgi:predicted transcriptional regulator
MATKRAGDIMIPLENYPHVSYWATLKEAVDVIENYIIESAGRKSLPRALLVFDEEHNLLGVVRRRDILRGLEPKFLKTMSVPERKRLFNIEIDPNLVELSAGRVGEEMKAQADQPVSEVMQPILATVRHDDHLAKIIYKMINRDLYMIPVMHDNKVVGVIRSVDVFQEVARLLNEL